MNKDLLIEKLSVIAMMCEGWTREGSAGSIEDNIMIQERMSIIRRNVTACLLALSEADTLEELSPVKSPLPRAHPEAPPHQYW